MSQSLHDFHSNAIAMWAMREHEVGDMVQHFQTGRSGTVTAVHADGLHIYIKFDLFNPDGWKYNNDGWNEVRKRNVFIVTMKRGSKWQPRWNVGPSEVEASKRARLQ
jgi:hypothetical protein